MEAPAKSLKRVVDRTPEKCDILEEGQFLHPISIIDQLVLDGQLREILAKTLEKIKDEAIRNQILSQGVTIGTIQLSLRTGDSPEAELVFPSFEEAYAALLPNPEAAFKMYDVYIRRFDLTPEQKKI